LFCAEGKRAVFSFLGENEERRVAQYNYCFTARASNR